MLRVWNSTDKYFRLGAYLYVRGYPGHISGIVVSYDPILQSFQQYNLFVPLDPLQEKSILNESISGAANLISLSTRPVGSYVKDNSVYDEQHYGSFLDSIQGFWSVFDGKPSLASPHLVHNQHYVRHRSFRGQAATGIVDLSSGTLPFDTFNSFFGTELEGKRYASEYKGIVVSPSGLTSYLDHPYAVEAVDATPMLDYLSSKGTHTIDAVLGGTLFSITISNFRYRCERGLSFSYDIQHNSDGPPPYETHYQFFYDNGSLYKDIGPSGADQLVHYRHEPITEGIRNVTSNVPTDYYNYSMQESITDTIVMGIPATADVDSVSDYAVVSRLFTLANPFWESVRLNWPDITALSRDTATTALTRLASMAYTPTFGRIGALNPLKAAADSLLANTVNAAISDALRISLKRLLGLGGGAGLVKYRTIFSDCLQLIGSLEVLGSLRNEPSRRYTATARYEYPVILGGRDCVVRVRSKVYLELSPFGLLQILIGKQSITILNDLLALYYTSIPLGEILLTLLQLRRVGDYVSNRMFYELPMFFIHSYTVETQLNQAELDYTGISSVDGPVRITYYQRDVSQHLPTLRFSALTPFYSTGDVGNIIWSLLQQLIGVLSSG